MNRNLTGSASCVLAAHAAWRAEVVPRAASGGAPSDASEGGGVTPAGRCWADLMRRAFEVDVLACPRCGGRLRLVALLEAGTVTARILRHLGLPSEVPAARPARAPARERRRVLVTGHRPDPAVVAPARVSRHTLYGARARGRGSRRRVPSVASRAVTGHQRSSRGRCWRSSALWPGRIFGESRRQGPIRPVPLTPGTRSSRLSSPDG